MLSDLMITIILRGIPEGFIYMFGMYAFAGKTIEKKKYIVSSMILAIVLIFISKLPISFGIHSILVVMAIIALSVGINQISTVKAISIAIINMIIQFIAEGLNIALIQGGFKLDMIQVMSNPLSKAIYGIPSLIIFCSVVCIAYKLKKKVV